MNYHLLMQQNAEVSKPAPQLAYATIQTEIQRPEPRTGLRYLSSPHLESITKARSNNFYIVDIAASLGPQTKYMGDLQHLVPVTRMTDLLREFSENGRSLAVQSRDLHLRILQKAAISDFDYLDILLRSPSLETAHDVIVLSLLRGTFTIRNRLHYWAAARNAARDALTSRGRDVRQLMRGLLEE